MYSDISVPVHFIWHWDDEIGNNGSDITRSCFIRSSIVSYLAYCNREDIRLCLLSQNVLKTSSILSSSWSSWLRHRGSSNRRANDLTDNTKSPKGRGMNRELHKIILESMDSLLTSTCYVNVNMKEICYIYG